MEDIFPIGIIIVANKPPECGKWQKIGEKQLEVSNSENLRYSFDLLMQNAIKHNGVIKVVSVFQRIE